MRTAVALLVLATAVAGGARAATIVGTAPGTVLRGTAGPDLIVAHRGPVRVDARGGNDRVAVQYNGARDAVRCGPGRDVVTADRRDVVARDCEVVSRLISRDTYAIADGQHETQAEPHAVADGRTIVATFQTGRRHSGGAADIGFSTSRDGGLTWRDGHLPGVTVNSKPAGTAPYASDPVVGRDAVRGVWLISTLAVSQGATELYISRSRDGLRWEPPVVAARAATPRLAYDKNWVACDNWPQSPRRGRCYLAYTDHLTSSRRIAVQVSDDGGLTWSEPVIAVRAAEAVGVLILPRPDGSVVMPYLGEGELRSVRSLDGGQSFEQPVTVARYAHRRVPEIRAFPLPAADVDARGRLYVTWQDCRFRGGCPANDVAFSTSEDGGSWAAPRRATRDRGTAFMPAIAVQPATGRLALVYHRCTGSPCRIDVFVRTSANGGRSWTGRQRLNAQTMRAGWLPSTVSGRMLGDYVGAVWSGGRPVVVYALASPPRGGKLRQATAAVRLP